MSLTTHVKFIYFNTSLPAC